MKPILVPLLLLGGFFASPVFAQDSLDSSADADAPGLPGDEDEEEDVGEEPEVQKLLTPEERIMELEDRVFQLEQRIKQNEEFSLKPQSITFHGFVDFGFFIPRGNGAGWVQDFGNRAFPQYEGRYAWVFLGDILATAINSRGEAADLGDAPGVERFDSVRSRGALGFILNQVNFRADVGFSESAILRTSVNFVPRTGSEFDLGDFLDVDIAELEWMFTSDRKTSFFVGKIEPVFGIEYKERRADDRFGITPSLVHRYTSGPQLGLKIRSKLFDEWLILAASVTNGSSSTEQFHFFNEVDANSGKTANGRIAVAIPLSEFFSALSGDVFEIGVSGEIGPQDRALDNEGLTWFAGVDFEYRSTSFAVKGQWIRGHSEGSDAERVWKLDLWDSGYVEADWMFLPELGALVRGSLRDAFVSLLDERAYITKSWQLTFGLRAVLTDHVIVKAEYVHNGEFGGIPAIKNDVFTSSLVLRY